MHAGPLHDGGGRVRLVRKDVSGWYGRRDETCPVSTGGRGVGGHRCHETDLSIHRRTNSEGTVGVSVGPTVGGGGGGRGTHQRRLAPDRWRGLGLLPPQRDHEGRSRGAVTRAGHEGRSRGAVTRGAWSPSRSEPLGNAPWARAGRRAARLGAGGAGTLGRACSPAGNSRQPTSAPEIAANGSNAPSAPRGFHASLLSVHLVRPSTPLSEIAARVRAKTRGGAAANRKGRGGGLLFLPPTLNPRVGEERGGAGFMGEEVVST